MINSLSSLHRKTGPPHPTSLPRKTEKRCPNQRWRPCGWHLASSVPWRRPNPKSPMTSSTKLVKDRRHPTVRRRPAASRRYRRWCRHRRRRLAPMTPLPSNWSPVTCTRRRPICSTRSRERWCWPIASRRAVRTPAVRRSTTRRACASSSAPTPTRFRVSAFESHRPKRLPINRRLSSVLFCFVFPLFLCSLLYRFCYRRGRCSSFTAATGTRCSDDVAIPRLHAVRAEELSENHAVGWSGRIGHRRTRRAAHQPERPAQRCPARPETGVVPRRAGRRQHRLQPRLEFRTRPRIRAGHAAQTPPSCRQPPGLRGALSRRTRIHLQVGFLF